MAEVTIHPIMSADGVSVNGAEIEISAGHGYCFRGDFPADQIEPAITVARIIADALKGLEEGGER